jgi:peptidoglycan/xylan/chitin deacetylase (PgdA/CDA1 family)
MMLDVASRTHPPVVLAYHGVNDVDAHDDPMRLVTPPRILREQVRWLQRRGYRFLTAEELLAETAGGRPRPRTAVLTFDDGWRDAVDVTSPLLQELGVRATYYLNPGRWGGQHPDVTGPAGRLLEEDQARSLQEAGMDLGAHTMTHPDLRLLDPAARAWELAASKAAVEQITGRPCRTLAYPFGLFDTAVAAAVADAGYEMALSWQPGPWRGPFAVPRLPAPPRNGARRLALKLYGLRVPDGVPRPLTARGVGSHLAARLR